MSPATSCQGRNIFGDKILFRMVRHADSVELIVERDESVSMLTSSSAVFVAGFALSSLLTQEIADHLCVAFILTVVYWSANAFLTVTSERIQIFHFAHGLQYSRHYLFGFRKVLFIHSQRVILNEVVSMQRVIVFLSCLLGPGDSRLSGGNRSKYEIIPLLTHLHPRQPLLKVIYNHLLEAFKKTTPNGTSSSAKNHTNHFPAESQSNKSLAQSRESFSSVPVSASSALRQGCESNHLSSC